MSPEKQAYNREYMREYRKKNADKVKAWVKKSVSNNLDKVRERHKNWRLANKTEYNEKRNIYLKKLKETNINYVISHKLRNRLSYLLKSGSAINELGCSIEEFKIYIESKFQPGMTWDNWSRTGWHMDHILPLSKFDLTNSDEFKKAVHYTNLQPLWAKENLKKNKSINLEGDEDNVTEVKK